MSIAIILCDKNEEDILRFHAQKLGGNITVYDAQNIEMDTIKNHSHVVMLAHKKSQELLSIFGAKIDAQPITNIIEIIDENTFVRPIYAGNALATIRSDDAIKLLSINASQTQKTIASRDLKNAQIVIGGGRALASKENFQLLYDLASEMGGAVGATRAAVDAGYIGNEAQIGQSGVTISPDLYLCLGVSGALQHVGGIRNAKTVIAVNTDPNAPIFKHATYGLVADLFEILPALTKKLKA